MAGLYQSHETFWSDAKMYVQMIMRSIMVGVCLQISVMGYALYDCFNREIFFVDALGTKVNMPTSATFRYHTRFAGLFTNEVEIPKTLLPYGRGHRILPIDTYRQFVDWLSDGAYAEQERYLSQRFKLSFFGYLCSIGYLWFFLRKSERMEDTQFIRGAQLTPTKAFNKKLATAAAPNSLQIGDMTWPFELETKHMLVLGTAGSGKGVLLNQLIAQINARKALQGHEADRCVFYDLKGEFVAKQFQPGDLIFSPFDSRSLGWSIFNEIEISPDYDVIAQSLFSPPADSEPYWYLAAADVFRAGLLYLKLNNRTSNAELWEFFSQSPASIKNALKSLPVNEQGASKHIDQPDSPSTNSVLSILQSRLKFFYYLVGQDGEFSFRKYIRNGVHCDGAAPHPNLFFLNIEQYAALFSPLMTMVIDTMCREILSMPDDLNRRVYFIIDELGTLNKMDSIIKLETVGRSKGAGLVCVNQDLGRIEEQYGRANLKSFYNNFNTTFTFRIREPETAEFLSKAIGEQQVIKTSQSRQMSPNEIGDRKSVNEQERTERLILPAEFQTLPDFCAYVNIAGYGVSQIKVPPVFYKERYPGFVMREFEPLSAVSTQTTQEVTEEQKPAQESAKHTFAKLRI